MEQRRRRRETGLVEMACQVGTGEERGDGAEHHLVPEDDMGEAVLRSRAVERSGARQALLQAQGGCHRFQPAVRLLPQALQLIELH